MITQEKVLTYSPIIISDLPLERNERLDLLEKAKGRLEKGYELLLDKKRWCTGEFARDEKGFYTSFRGEEAFSFCALGALYRNSEEPRYDDSAYSMPPDIIEAEEYLRRASLALYNAPVSTVNDYPTPQADPDLSTLRHARVLTVYRQAIQDSEIDILLERDKVRA